MTTRSVRQNWSQSHAFRMILVVTLLYAVLRLGAQVIFLADLVSSGDTEGEDLQIYIDAAHQVLRGEDLYPKGTIEEIEFYQYSPFYALIFIPFALLSFGPSAILLSVLHLLAYALLYLAWARILSRLNLDLAGRVWAWTLPLWLVFSAFWSDLVFINVYVFMALLATLAIEAVLDERLWPALLWLSIILQIKPQWAFFVALPLLLGRYRFFIKLLGSALLVYAGIVVVTMLAVGPGYGWQQHLDYWRLLISMSGGNYAWKEPDFAFLGYNHSISQILVYLFGAKPAVLGLSLASRLVLLMPLLLIALQHLVAPCKCRGRDVPELSLALVFALYLGVFIWMNVVWELTLAIAVFAFLAITEKRHGLQVVVWAAFVLYALLDFWRLLSVGVLGDAVFLEGSFVMTDPALYFPIVMLVILTFYAALISRLLPQSLSVARSLRS